MTPLLIKVITLGLVVVIPALGQDTTKPATPDFRDEAIQRIVDKINVNVKDRGKTPFEKAVDPSNTTDFIRFYTAASAAGSAVVAVQNNQTDHQQTAAPASSGATSLTQKGASSQILSFAVENGGLQREISGTTVTFRGKPVGFLEAFKKYDLLDVLASVEADPVKQFLNRFSFALAFDANRGGVQNTLLANSQQLKSWSARVEMVNRRDARRRQYAWLWRTLSKDNATAVGNAEAEVLTEQLEKWDEFKTWRRELQELAKGFDLRLTEDATKKDDLIQEFNGKLRAKLAEVSGLLHPPTGLTASLAKVMTVWTKLDAGGKKITDYIQKGQLLTVDWTTKRDPSLPDLYTNTLVYEFSPAKSRVDDFTLNVAANWYRVAPKQPAGTGRFKDFNAVAEYAIPIGKLDPVGKLILSFTGKYQYVAASVVNATSISAADVASKTASSSGTGAGVLSTTPPSLANLLPTLKGSLGAFQVKLSIPGGKSGVRIPLAFTAATRSEVFNKPDYRANVGISFNIDSLFAK